MLSTYGRCKEPVACTLRSCALTRINAHDLSTPKFPLSSRDKPPWHVMLPESDETAVREQPPLPLTQATAVRGKQTNLVVLRREVGDKRHRSLAITAVDMAQHDCLVKGLSCCNLTVVATQVQMLASHSDVALPFLRALVLTHAMVARGLGLKAFLFSSALYMHALVGEGAAVKVHASHATDKHLPKGAMHIQEGNMRLGH